MKTGAHIIIQFLFRHTFTCGIDSRPCSIILACPHNRTIKEVTIVAAVKSRRVKYCLCNADATIVKCRRLATVHNCVAII